MAYGEFEDLAKRTTFDKVKQEIKEIKHLILLKIQNMMNIKEVLSCRYAINKRA